MSRIHRYMSDAEAEDLAVTCALKGGHKLSIISRRSIKREAGEESAIIVRKDVEGNPSSDDEDTVLAIAITSHLKYEFVGNGIFLVAPLSDVASPSGHKSKESYYFETKSLHDMWSMVTVLEETLAFTKMENYSKIEGHGDWLKSYFKDDPLRISEFVWEAKKDVHLGFSQLPRVQTPPASSPTEQKSSMSHTRWSKPDLDELKGDISLFIRSSADPDDITEGDVIEHLKSKYGPSIVGKYGYSKADIQLWTYTFYGQLEKPSKIDDNLYLGSEYNAANCEELQSLGVTHILNVTCEVSRHFPTEFKYHQVHVLDVPSVNLLPYFHRALSFMESGMNEGGSVFVHCQRGVSRSATFVIAHMMKAKRMSLADALKHVKDRRRIVKPNTGFVTQLRDWEAMLEKGVFISDAPTFARNPVSQLREKHETRVRENTNKATQKSTRQANKRNQTEAENEPATTTEIIMMQVSTSPPFQQDDVIDSATTIEDESAALIEMTEDEEEILFDENRSEITVMLTNRYSVLDVVSVLS